MKYPALTLNGNNGTATQGTVYTKYGTTDEYTTATGTTPYLPTNSFSQVSGTNLTNGLVITSVPP